MLWVSKRGGWELCVETRGSETENAKVMVDKRKDKKKDDRIKAKGQ